MFGLFDFNRDGETDATELALGISIAITIGGENESVEEETGDLKDLEAELEELEETLSELEDKLSDLEDQEPEDCTSDAYGRWERRKEQLEEQISEIEDQISEVSDKIDELA